jgi:hypothetical protein
MRRALDCFCGQYLEGASDEQLFSLTQGHMDQEHPNVRMTAEQIRRIVAEGAYDTEGGDYE